MRIDAISIGNFRCFDDLKLTFHPYFNVLIGNNAAGKTAVLEAITVALGAWIAGIGGLDARNLREATDVRRVPRWYGSEVTFEPQYPTEVVAAGEILGERMTWNRILSRPSGNTRFGVGDIRTRAEQAAKRARDGEALTLPVVAYYGSGRLAGDASPKKTTKTSLEQADLSRLEGYRDAITNGHINPRMFVLWLEYQDRIAYTERLESPLNRAVRKAVTAMVPFAKETRFEPKTRDITIIFDDGSAHPFSELSDGQRGIATLAGDIAVRMARLNPHLAEHVLAETPGVILIDELDLHLHPRWQHHVATDLRRTFPRVQFITTTHSPQIVGQVEPECVTILSTNENGTISVSKASQSYGLDSNGILERLMGAPARPRPVNDKIDAIDDALEAGKWDQARTLLEDLRRALHGDDPEVVRLETSIHTLEALAGAVD